MRKLVLMVLLVATVVWGGCGEGGKTRAHTAAPSTTATESPLSVVQAYVDDFNRGDVTAAVMQFASDAQFITPLGRCSPCVGRDAIRAKLEGAVAAKTQLSMTNPRTSGDTVTAPSSLTSPQLPPGVTRALGTFTATVRDGQIVRSTMEYDASDPQTAALLAISAAPAPSQPPRSAASQPPG